MRMKKSSTFSTPANASRFAIAPNYRNQSETDSPVIIPHYSFIIDHCQVCAQNFSAQRSQRKYTQRTPRRRVPDYALSSLIHHSSLIITHCSLTLISPTYALRQCLRHRYSFSARGRRAGIHHSSFSVVRQIQPVNNYIGFLWFFGRLCEGIKNKGSLTFEIEVIGLMRFLQYSLLMLFPD